MNGWQRLGVVASAAWILFIIAWVLHDLSAHELPLEYLATGVVARWLLGPVLALWIIGYVVVWLRQGFKPRCNAEKAQP